MDDTEQKGTGAKDGSTESRRQILTALLGGIGIATLSGCEANASGNEGDRQK